jgi:O-antigen ligase/polysaccharide polymerase Wzy-like membrane protein
MTNSPVLLRSVLIYAICLPLAIFLGYRMSDPLSLGSFGVVGAVILLLCFPLLLRFHHPLLVLCWNFTLIVFFLPGAPSIWLPLTACSLTISLIRRAIDHDFRFVSVPVLTRPLIVLTIVILVTAQATGGIKLRSMGGDVFGGKRYVLLLGAIAGYFALTAYHVPLKRARLYTWLFLFGGITALIGDLVYFRSSSLGWIFWMFPPTGYLINQSDSGLLRFAGLNVACSVLFSWMMARYGIRGIFSMRRPWRLGFFVIFVCGSFLGGFRSTLVLFCLTFAIQFFLEGLHRTRLVLVFLLGAIFVGTLAIPFAQRFPYSVQRTLSLIPGVPVEASVRLEAEGSTEWRLNIWKAVLPQVPRYLLMGKGLAMTPQDFDYSFSTFSGTMKEFSEDQNWAALAGDYHSGPLSVIIPFGIWGVIAFVWFLSAGCLVMYRNFRYGDPSLKVINGFLFATFIAKIFIFLFIFGGFYGDIQGFAGYLGVSVCLNGGMAKKPDAESAPEADSVASNPSIPLRSRLVSGRHS